MPNTSETTDPVEMHRIRSRAEAARILDISVSTLERWERIGFGPKAIKIGLRRVGYRTADLIAHANGQSTEVAA